MPSRPHIVEKYKERYLSDLRFEFHLCKHIILFFHRQGLQTLHHFLVHIFSSFFFSTEYYTKATWSSTTFFKLHYSILPLMYQHKQNKISINCLHPLLSPCANLTIPKLSFFPDSEKPKRCQGLGLFYAFLATVFFSIIALLVKTIEGIHAIEISAIRCFFQMLFTMPLLIYHK